MGAFKKISGDRRDVHRDENRDDRHDEEVHDGALQGKWEHIQLLMEVRLQAFAWGTLVDALGLDLASRTLVVVASHTLVGTIAEDTFIKVHHVRVDRDEEVRGDRVRVRVRKGSVTLFGMFGLLIITFIGLLVFIS